MNGNQGQGAGRRASRRRTVPMRLPSTTGFREPQMQGEQNREALLRVSTDLYGSLNSGIWDGGGRAGTATAVCLGPSRNPYLCHARETTPGPGSRCCWPQGTVTGGRNQHSLGGRHPGPGGTRGRQDGNQRKASPEALLLRQPCLLISRWPHHLDAQSSGLGF